MHNNLCIIFIAVVMCISALAAAQDKDDKDKTAEPQQGGDFSYNPLPKMLPTDVILVKGAVASATDPITPVPESGAITERVYTNKYFRMSFPLPPGFVQKFTGPPPSDSGYYVLTQMEPSEEFQTAAAGSILISAQDMFFTFAAAKNALEFVNFKMSRLNSDYKLERPPAEVTIANRTFVRMDYMAPVAELHWHTLTSQVRCHTVEFMFTSRDAELLELLVQGLNRMTFAEDAGASAGRKSGNVPVCIKNYASGENVKHKVDPVFTDRRFNSIPVRVIIDKQGKVKHVHVISAFPDQAKVITDALLQWEFKPHVVNGEPVEVETGIIFGATQPSRQTKSASVAQ
ncbi:MAG TPA: hypothetical protein VFL42_00565 [Terriglobales bacterium]|nr:hypothetical protein [Terriglobales bacterium]